MAPADPLRGFGVGGDPLSLLPLRLFTLQRGEIILVFVAFRFSLRLASTAASRSVSSLRLGLNGRPCGLCSASISAAWAMVPGVLSGHLRSHGYRHGPSSAAICAVSASILAVTAAILVASAAAKSTLA